MSNIILLVLGIIGIFLLRLKVCLTIDNKLYDMVKDESLCCDWYSKFDGIKFVFNPCMWQYWTTKSVYKKLSGINYSIK